MESNDLRKFQTNIHKTSMSLNYITRRPIICDTRRIPHMKEGEPSLSLNTNIIRGMNDLFIRLERCVFLVLKVHAGGTLGGCAGLIREVKVCTSGERVTYSTELYSLKHSGNTS